MPGVYKLALKFGQCFHDVDAARLREEKSMSCSLLSAVCPAAMIIGALFTAASALLWTAAGIMIARRFGRRSGHIAVNAQAAAA
jgi:hypothetical protein